MVKALKIVIPLLLIALLLFYVVPFPVDTQVRGLEIKMDDPAYCVERVITIKGQHAHNLFSPDEFTGSLQISGYESRIGDRAMASLVLEDGYPVTFEYSAGNGFLKLGNLYWQGDWADMILAFVLAEDENSNSTENCYVIVAGAENRESAYQAFASEFWN